MDQTLGAVSASSADVNRSLDESLTEDFDFEFIDSTIADSADELNEAFQKRIFEMQKLMNSTS